MNFAARHRRGRRRVHREGLGHGGHGSLYGAYWLDRPPLLVALYKLAVTGGAVGIRVLGALAALALVAATTLRHARRRRRPRRARRGGAERRAWPARSR